MRRHLTLVVVLAFATCGVAYAQETTTGSIGGKVLDTQGAVVPGAAVTVTSPQGSRTFVTDSVGRFFAPFLTPGVHSVRVELAGFSPVEQTNITVRLGQRLELSFTLTVSDIQEVVEVVGTTPVVDVSSTTAGGTLDSDVLKMLPVARNFTGTLYLVPGVSDSSGVGNANPSIGGASGLENHYIVDGINITDTGFGGVGVYSIRYGSLGTGVTTDFIKETQVKTAGFEAEYGQATGGVVNVVTKSGSNQFNGSVFGYFSPSALESDWKTLESPNGTVNTLATENYDFGLTVGGPLMQDKLFFFGAVNPQYQTRTYIAPDDPANFPLRALGETDRKRQTLSYAGKLTWQSTTNHRFDFTAFGDPSKGDMGPQSSPRMKGQDTDAFSELDYASHNQAARYDGILTSNWLLEASFSRATNRFDETPNNDSWAVSDRRGTPFIRTGGPGFIDRATEGENLQYQLKSTHIFNAGGNHQLRYGIQFEDITFARDRRYTGASVALPNGEQTRGGVYVTVLSDENNPVIYRAIRGNFGTAPLTQGKYLSWFAQDTWRIGDRLTFKPGIRWERERLVGGGDPVCYENDSRPGAGDGSGTAIHCEFTWTNNWGPRIGAIYDIKGDGTSKVYASWGRFYAKVPQDLASRALSADAGITRADFYDAGLTESVPDGADVLGTTSHFVTAGSHPSVFDPDARSTYSDEIIGGLEFEAAPSLALGVRYINRKIPRILEDIGQAAAVLYDLGLVPSEVDYFITNVNVDTPTVNDPSVPAASFEDPTHKYHSVEVTANKGFSDNWSLIASYRWSKLEGDFEGFYRSDNGQSDPAITSLFDFPTNDPSYTQVGTPTFGYVGDMRFQGTSQGVAPLPNDRPHQFKIYGTYAWSNLNLGLGFNLGSGRQLTALAANPIYNNAGEIPMALRGEGIETVDDGFVDRTKTELLFDLHADYTLRFGEQRMVLIADVFNLFNWREATWYDVDTESSFLTANPNYGYAQACGSCSSQAYHAPRRIRLGARFEW